MVVAHNLLAMNANRQFNITNRNKSKSTEKLSSGYKINRASDDAAGLSISEGMRKRIRGLDQGARNIQDGISLCQVADGALSEVHSMLQRMTELAVQSANGTNSAQDRKYLNNEINEIKLEIDRIAHTTDFNGAIYPLTDTKRESTYTTIPGDVIQPENITVNFDYTDVKFDARPFNEKTPLNVISLFAQVQGTGTDADGRLYSLLYTGGTNSSDRVINGLSSKTSYPGVIFKAGDVSKNVQFSDPNFKFKSFTDNSANGNWKRVFTYTDPDDSNISFDVIQTVTMNASSNSYTIDTYLSNIGTKALDGEHLIYMNFDTAYKGAGTGDRNEGYYIKSGEETNQVMNESLYVKGMGQHIYPYAEKLGSAGTEIYNYYKNMASGSYTAEGRPKSFLIGSKDTSDANGWMPFSIEISLDPYADHFFDLGDFLILGNYYNNRLNLFSTCGGDGVGNNIYGQDHAFTYGSFSYNNMVVKIVNPDTIAPQITQKLPDTVIRTDYDEEQKPVHIQCSNVVEDELFIDIVNATLEGLNLQDADISTKENALNTLGLVSDALDKVSEYRGYFGAQQNRLEHSLESNRYNSENTQATESRIRDTDMAEEIVKYAKHGVLEQAGQSMLTHANQNVQGILTLLGS